MRNRIEQSDKRFARAARRMVRILCLGAGVATATGCDYQVNGSDPAPTSGYQWRSLYREDIHTVAVPIFTNRDFHRGVEFALTKAVKSDIESHTPYKVVDEDHADTVLEGEISSIKVGTLSEDPNSVLPQEQLLNITVNYTWKEIRSGRILKEVRNFQESTTYYPTLGESQTDGGSQVGVERLALEITRSLQAPWGKDESVAGQ
jgi:hypothetical protein